MIKVTSIQSTTATVENENGPVKLDFAPLDLGGLSVKEAFVLGMAYDLLENRGIAVPPPPMPAIPDTTFDRNAESEEI